MLKNIGVFGALAAVSLAACSTRIIEREVIHTPAHTGDGASRTSARSRRSGRGTATAGSGRNHSTGPSRRHDMDSGVLEFCERTVRLGGWTL